MRPLFSLFHVVGLSVLGEIEGHQRLETIARRNGPDNAFAIGAGIGGGDDRRHQVRHDDGTGEMAARIPDHPFQHCPVTQVQVPVIRAAQGERLHRDTSEHDGIGARLASFAAGKQPPKSIGRL